MSAWWVGPSSKRHGDVAPRDWEFNSESSFPGRLEYKDQCSHPWPDNDSRELYNKISVPWLVPRDSD